MFTKKLVLRKKNPIVIALFATDRIRRYNKINIILFIKNLDDFYTNFYVSEYFLA